MKVAFVQTLPVMLESYLVLSASLKKNNFETEVFIESFEDDMVQKIVDSGAELIGFNSITGSYNWVCDTARKIKAKKDIPIVIGGCHPTYYPEAIDPDIFDYLCVGEGDDAIVELAEAIANKRDVDHIRNIGLWKDAKLKMNELRPLIRDIGELPFSDRDLYHKYDYFMGQDLYQYRTSRHCPYACTFCFVTNFARLYKGQKVFREYPVDYIIAEMKNVKKDYKNLKTMFFSDDVFGINKAWTRELLRKYKEKINIPYVITTRVDLIDDELIQQLKETGCRLVSMSLETANEKIRRDVLNKDISNERAIEAGRKLHDAGIRTRIDCIFCLPGETLEDAFQNVKLMKEMKATDPVGFLLQPFPKTDINNIAVERGCLKSDIGIDDLDPLIYFKTPIKLPQKKEIIVVQRLFVWACKIPYFDKLLRILVRVPNNFLFDLVHRTCIAISHKRFYGLSWMGLIKYLNSARKLNKRRASP